MSTRVFVNDSNPEHIKSGDAFTFAATWEDASSVTSPTCTCFVDGAEDPDSILSGTTTVTSTTQTSKTITIPATYGGKRVIVELAATVDGNLFAAWFDFRVDELPK